MLSACVWCAAAHTEGTEGAMTANTDNQHEQAPLVDQGVVSPFEHSQVQLPYVLTPRDVWPELAEPAQPIVMNRGQFLKLSATALAAIALGGGTYVVNREAERSKRAKETIDAYLKAKFANLPNQEQLIAGIPYGGNIVRVLRLDDIQRRYNMSGPIGIREAAVGTSMSYGLGTMDDHTGPLNQPHAVPQRGFGALSPAARQLLGIDSAEAWMGAVPGADSSWGNSSDPRGLYGLLTQLSSADMWAWLQAAGPNELPIVRYETFGLDDLRQLAVTIHEFADLANDLFRFLTDDKFTDKAKAYIDVVEAKLKGIALGFGNNMVAAAAMVNEYNKELRAQDKAEMAFTAVYSPNVGKGDRIPFSAIDGNNNDPSIQRILRPDEVDLNFLNRWFLDLNAMPYGHEIATWAWTLMFQAQNAALVRIRQLFPGLIIPVELQLDVNDGDDFYPVKRPDGLWIPEGDGHAGIVVGGKSGLEKSGKATLTIYERDIHGRGATTADQLAEFKPYAA